LSFQSKLLLVYLIFIVLLVMALGTSFYVISSKTLEENAYTNLNVLVNKMSQQMDGLISPMDFISLNLISKGNFMSSMKSLVLLERNNPDNSRFIMEAYSEIYQELMNYTIGRNYYRVSYFNLQGDFISSNVTNTLEMTQYREIINGIEWLDDVESSNGGIIIIPPYDDPWALKEVKVFGVTRTDRSIDYNIGYIEVQRKYEELEKAFFVENDSHIRIVAITKENKLLYSSGVDDPEILNYYVSLANQGNLEATTLFKGNRDRRRFRLYRDSHTAGSGQAGAFKPAEHYQDNYGDSCCHYSGNFLSLCFSVLMVSYETSSAS